MNENIFNTENAQKVNILEFEKNGNEGKSILTEIFKKKKNLFDEKNKKKFLKVGSGKKKQKGGQTHFFARGVMYKPKKSVRGKNLISNGYGESFQKKERNRGKLSSYVEEIPTRSYSKFKNLFKEENLSKKMIQGNKCSMDDRNPTFSSQNYNLSIKKSQKKLKNSSRQKLRERQQRVFKHPKSSQIRSKRNKKNNLSLASININFMKGRVGLGVRDSKASRNSGFRGDCSSRQSFAREGVLRQSKSFLSSSVLTRKKKKQIKSDDVDELLEMKENLQGAILNIDKKLKDFLKKVA